jgi:PAS domain S-box-containing protein
MLYHDYFQDLLRQTNISVKVIAEELGVSIGAVYKWKSGENRPQKHHVNKLAELESEKIKWLTNEEIEYDDLNVKGGKMSQTDRVTNYLIDEIDNLKSKITKLETGGVPNLPHPEAFEEMAKLLENITKQWNWTFYHSPNPMSCSRNGKVKAINPELEKALGWTEDEMFGSDILDYIHKDDLEKTKKALTQKDRNLTVRIKKKNGNHCTMHVQAKEFGINSKKYSIGLMTCVDKGCPDIKENDG